MVSAKLHPLVIKSERLLPLHCFLLRALPRPAVLGREEPDGVVTPNLPFRLPNDSYRVLVGNTCCRPEAVDLTGFIGPF